MKATAKREGRTRNINYVDVARTFFKYRFCHNGIKSSPRIENSNRIGRKIMKTATAQQAFLNACGKALMKRAMYLAAILFSIIEVPQIEGQIIQVGSHSVDLSMAQPLATNDIPQSATFYLLSLYDPTNNDAPPVPGDIYFPETPVYSMGGDVYLIDDTHLDTITNTPVVIPWPVSLSELELVTTNLPDGATFFLYTDQENGDTPPPYPQNPCSSCPVYSLGIPNVFLVDDRNWTRPQPAEDQSSQPSYRALSFGADLALYITGISNSVVSLILTNSSPGVNYDIECKPNLSVQTWSYLGTITGATNQNFTAFVVPVGTLGRSLFFRAAISFPMTSVWVEIPPGGLIPGQLTLVIHNTIQDQPYDLLASSDLTAPVSTWNIAQTVTGSAGSSTITQLPVDAQGNLFVYARFAGNPDGSGIPLWWELQHGIVGVDPYAFDSSGDSYTYLQDFLNGFTPGMFYTPAAPVGLAVNYNSGTGAANVNWFPSPGAVLGYNIEKYDGQTGVTNYFNFGSNILAFADFVAPSTDIYGVPQTYGYYRAQAVYAAGNSAWTDRVLLEPSFDPNWPFGANLLISIVPGPGGSAYLAAAALPADTTTLRLTRVDTYAAGSYGDYSFNTNIDIPVSNLTNGLYQLPASVTSASIDSYGNGHYEWSAAAINTLSNSTASVSLPSSEVQLDGVSHLFPLALDGRVQLKQNLIFNLRAATVSRPFSFDEIWYDQHGTPFTQHHSNPSNYVFSDFYPINPYDFHPDAPFVRNYMFRNFAWSLGDVDANGLIATGVASDYFDNTVLLYDPPSYQFQWPLTNAILATNQTRWLCAYGFDSSSWFGEFGVTLDASGYHMGSSANIYGLTFLSAQVEINQGTLNTTLLTAPGSVTNGQYFYPEAAQPQFQTVEYDFWRPGVDQLPVNSGFSPTNANHLLIASVGTPFKVAGYAKLAVANGFSGVFGYLGQYFDKAYKIGIDGNATATQTGALSPYGDFFPTEPGPVALKTMPDVDSGECGTGIVNVIKLQLDVNHDAIMDLSFAGPDNTSPAHPFVFWVNNDCDTASPPGCPECDFGHDSYSPKTPDGGVGYIHSIRDLEDYARLWICGVPALTNGGYQVTLSWANVGSGYPAVRLFKAAETNGGTGYLSNTNTAIAQATWSDGSPSGVGGPGMQLGAVTPDQPYYFPASFFKGSDKYLLFEGMSTNGSGELLLTISKAGHVVAQTGAWLELHDVKDFYERAIITNSITGDISNWTTALTRIESATSSALNSDTNIIVYTHGGDNDVSTWLMRSDTIFKRLYWSGYRGKFASVRWPSSHVLGMRFGPSWYNETELVGYQCGFRLKEYSVSLRNRFPNHKMHLFTHSAGGPIASEALSEGALFDTLILASVSLPASSYDANAPTNPDLLAAESERHTPEWQPMGYRGVYTNFPNRVVNYFNTIDSRLVTWWLAVNQAHFKPNVGYNFDGTNSYDIVNDPRLITDAQESRAMVSRSRTSAIGAQPPQPGQQRQGVVVSSVDLQAQFGIGDSDDEHGAFFTRPIQTIEPYYYQLLNDCNIPHSQLP